MHHPLTTNTLHWLMGSMEFLLESLLAHWLAVVEDRFFAHLNLFARLGHHEKCHISKRLRTHLGPGVLTD